MTADASVVRHQGDVVRAAADIAESGSGDIQAAISRVLDAIAAAETDGFRVGEDLSVTDTKRVDVFSMAARRTALSEHAEGIRWAAEQLVQTDTLVSKRLEAKATELQSRGVVPNVGPPVVPPGLPPIAVPNAGGR